MQPAGTTRQYCSVAEDLMVRKTQQIVIYEMSATLTGVGGQMQGTD